MKTYSTQNESYLTFPRRERDAEVYLAIVNSSTDLTLSDLMAATGRQQGTISGCLTRLKRDGFIAVVARRKNKETGKNENTHAVADARVVLRAPKIEVKTAQKTKTVAFVFDKNDRPTIDDLFAHFADAPMMMSEIFIENVFVNENEVAIELTYKKEIAGAA